MAETTVYTVMTFINGKFMGVFTSARWGMTMGYIYGQRMGAKQAGNTGRLDVYANGEPVDNEALEEHLAEWAKIASALT